MTTFLGKLGTQAENVYHAASYITPIAWTQSFYSWTTDRVVLPTTKWIWTKLEKQSSVVEQDEQLPKPSKRCAKGADCLVKPVIFIFRKAQDFLKPESLYEVCKYVKGATYPWIHAEPDKIPNIEQYNPFERGFCYTIVGVEKVGIQASRIIHVIAYTGEKTFAVRLFASEMAKELRPSFKKHFVEPVVADLEKWITDADLKKISGVDVKKLIAVPKATFIELFPPSVRSIAGAAADVIEDTAEKKQEASEKEIKDGALKSVSKVPNLVDQYLKAEEKQITDRVTKIEDDATRWLSNTVFREGVNSFVTPVVVSGLLSVSGYVVEVVSITALTQNAGGYLETVRTAAYVLSYLKYANYLMWGVNAGKTLYKLHQSYTPNFNGEAMIELRKSLTRQSVSDTNPKNDLDPTQVKEYSVVVVNQCKLPGVIDQIKDKTGLSGLIASAPLQTLKGPFDNFTQDIEAKSKVALIKYNLIDSPTVEEVSDDKPSKLQEAPTVTFPPPSNQPNGAVATKDAAVVPLLEIGQDPSRPADPSTTVIPPTEDSKSAVVSDANAVVALATDVFNIVTSPSVPATSTDAPRIETHAKKEADTNATPLPKQNWFNRITATVSRIAGAISKFMSNISPSFRSRFSGIFQGNGSVKSRIATFLRSFFTAK